MNNILDQKKLYQLSLGLLPLMFISCDNRPNIEKNPNIIYILADDMGYGDIQALNDSCRIPTPALNKMVANGITFTDAHSNSAVSTPTRYGTLTGRYAFRSRLKNGVLVGHEPSLIEAGRETVGSLLQRNGYHTACIGKWHLGLDWAKKDTAKPLFEGHLWDITNTDNVDYGARVGGGPADCGFDYSYIIPASLDIAPYVYLENAYVTNPEMHFSDGWKSDEARGMWYRKGDVASDFDHQTCLQQLTKKSIEYIYGAKDKGDPFFLFFPLTAPHTPWMPSADFKGKSGAGVYGDFVCMVDDVVKQIYEALEKSGQAQNTIVIFTSDNGSHWLEGDIKEFNHRANGDFSGMKSDIWEGGHRVPYIVTWPAQITQASKSDKLLCSTDLIATCAEMLDITLPYNVGEDSYSFWKVMKSLPSDTTMRKNLIYHSIEGLFGFREEEWALLDCKGSGGWSLPENKVSNLPEIQLYNLNNDIAEKENLASKYPERVLEMKKTLASQIEDGRSR